MKFQIILLFTLTFLQSQCQKYTTDIDKAYVECITDCLVKEQNCNELPKCLD